jgi:hypothetical protein
MTLHDYNCQNHLVAYMNQVVVQSFYPQILFYYQNQIQLISYLIDLVDCNMVPH